MIKKSVLAAGLAALAFAALPAIASATYPNPYLATEFSVENDVEFHPRLDTVGGTFVTCKEVSGKGAFEGPETGWIELAFEGECHTKLGLKCGSGEPSTEAITTTKLYFHLKTVDHGGVQTPGVLITPGEGEPMENGAHFVTFQCQILGKVVVGGNKAKSPFAGIVGTITSPEEETPSNTATLSFEQESQGVQTHRVVTNDNEETVEYDLKSGIGGDATETAGVSAKGIIELKPEIRTTAE
jgi:hypothetical protein